MGLLRDFREVRTVGGRGLIDELFGREPRPVHRLFGGVCACGAWEAQVWRVGQTGRDGQMIGWAGAADVLDQWLDHLDDATRREAAEPRVEDDGDAPIAPPG